MRARGCIVLALFVVVLAGVPRVAGAQVDDLQAAQRRANQAAAELSRAQEAQALADDTVAHLQTRVARVEERVAAVRNEVAQLAVRQYVQGTVRITRLLRMTDATQVVLAQQYATVVAATSTESLEQYRADKEDLRVEVAALEREQEERAAAVEDLRRRQAAAVRELERLARLEDRRAPPGRSSSAGPRRRQRRPQPSCRVAGSGGPGAGPHRGTGSPGHVDHTAVAGGGHRRLDLPGAGPARFQQRLRRLTWRRVQPHGQRHPGPQGPPVVANVGGVVTQRNGAISGLAYFLAGDDGNRYFGAHLDSFGASGRVSAGTVIGRVGNTGDAAGGPPHLHFEIRPGGSGYTNPYPTLTKYC